MELLTGEFKVTLDEKGRISFPAHLRRILNDTNLFITEGIDNCLWIYPAAEWKEMIKTVMDNSNPFSGKSRILRRRFIGPSQEVEIDKAGRIPITQNFREFAGLSKDCIVLGQIDYIEIWDEERYRMFKSASDEELITASEEVGNILMNNRGVSE